MTVVKNNAGACLKGFGVLVPAVLMLALLLLYAGVRLTGMIPAAPGPVSLPEYTNESMDKNDIDFSFLDLVPMDMPPVVNGDDSGEAAGRDEKPPAVYLTGPSYTPSSSGQARDVTPPFLAVEELTDNPILEEHASDALPGMVTAWVTMEGDEGNASSGPPGNASYGSYALVANYTLTGETEDGSTLVINGVPVPVKDGRFYYEMNMTEGENNVTVVSTDPSGNSEEWTMTRLIDRDRLPDWFEVGFGMDPLNEDTNDNNVTDDIDDYDYDGIGNYGEFSLGTSPLSNDTDYDNLTDTFEVLVSFTNPSSTDSNTDGILDSTEDPDYDGLDNFDEQNVGTDPFSSDTDMDGLPDGNETMLGLNPLSPDTDMDGLDDMKEMTLMTDPLNPDTNMDGLPDGSETYTQSFEHADIGASIDIDSVGGMAYVNITAEEHPYPLLANVTGIVSGFVDFDSDEQFETAIITMSYDNNTDPSGLKMYYFDEVTGLPVEEPVQGINVSGGYLWANTTHFSYRFLADPGSWPASSYVTWNRADEVYSAWEKMRIKARVNNTEPMGAFGVLVSFYENDASGELIGNDYVNIAGNSVEFAETEWLVEPGVDRICIRVDPLNGITEEDESNNQACRDITHNLDSDSDGLSDDEETGGMRLRFPYTPIHTDPYDSDTDDDGLTDGEEMGSYVETDGEKYYVPTSDPAQYDTDRDGLDDWEEVYGWETALITTKAAGDQIIEMLGDGRDYLGYITRYNVTSNPFSADTDDDGLNDYAEMLKSSSPRNTDSDTDGIPDGIDDAPGEFDRKPPEVRVTGISKRNIGPMVEVNLTCVVSDEAGIKRVYMDKGGHTMEVGDNTGKLTIVYRTTFISFISGTEFILKAEDNNGNVGQQVIYREDGELRSAAMSITQFVNSNGKNDVRTAGIISGLAWSLAQDMGDVAYLMSEPTVVVDSAAALNTIISMDGLPLIWEAFKSEASEMHRKSNPFPVGSREKLEYATAWSGGYVAGKLISLIIADKGISKGMGALRNTKAISAITKMKPVKLVKGVLSWASRNRLAIGAITVSGTYALDQMFPEADLFGVMDDVGMGYGKMMVLTGLMSKMGGATTRILSHVDEEKIAGVIARTSRKVKGGSVSGLIDALDETSLRKLAQLGDDVADDAAIIAAKVKTTSAKSYTLFNVIDELSGDARGRIRKGWNNVDIDGLIKIAEQRGTSSIRALSAYDDNVFRITCKAVANGFVDSTKVDPQDIAKYIKYWRGDPFADSAMIHRVVRMYNSPGAGTLIGDTGQWIDDVAVLKKGQHLGPNNGFGWDHIVAEGHNEQLKKIFVLADNDASVKEFIGKAIENGEFITSENKILSKMYSSYYGRGVEIEIPLSTESLGSITTVIPKP